MATKVKRLRMDVRNELLKNWTYRDDGDLLQHRGGWMIERGFGEDALELQLVEIDGTTAGSWAGTAAGLTAALEYVRDFEADLS